jgi:hypothetical protein
MEKLLQPSLRRKPDRESPNRHLLMPKQKPKPSVAGNRSIPKPTASPPSGVSTKERKQLAHNAPVRRAASKARE